MSIEVHSDFTFLTSSSMFDPLCNFLCVSSAAFNSMPQDEDSATAARLRVIFKNVAEIVGMGVEDYISVLFSFYSFVS